MPLWAPSSIKKNCIFITDGLKTNLVQAGLKIKTFPSTLKGCFFPPDFNRNQKIFERSLQVMGALALSPLYLLGNRAQCLTSNSAFFLGATWVWGGKKVPCLTVQPSFCLLFHHILGHSRTIEPCPPTPPSRKDLVLAHNTIFSNLI